MDNMKLSLLNGFSAAALDRAAHLRSDSGKLEELFASPSSRFMVTWQGLNLLSDGEPAMVTREALEKVWEGEAAFALLGMLGGRAIFLASLDEAVSDAPEKLSSLGHFDDLRKVAAFASEEGGGLCAYARGLAHFLEHNRFCGRCGTPTALTEGGHLAACTNEKCGALWFPRTDPVIIVLVTHGDKCLLGRQPPWPKGRYSALAGFVEPGETLEAAVAREAKEEAGVEINAASYRSSQPWPFPCSLMVGYFAEAKDEAITLDGRELEEARWFTRAELKAAVEEATIGLPPAFSISYRLIEDWLNQEDSTIKH